MRVLEGIGGAVRMDQITTQHNVDRNRVYLTGLSMGGYGAWSLGLAHPERFAALAPICGGGERISVMLASRNHLDDLVQLPIWAFHGAQDPVVPLEESQRMVDAMKRLGVADVRLTVYPEARHDAWTQTYADEEFFDWLFKQTR